MGKTGGRALAAAAILLCLPAGAGEWLVGIGSDDVEQNERTVALAVEIRSGPLLEFGPVALAAGAAAEVDLDADLWGGAGPVVALSIGRWRIGGSAMPGFYAEGGGNDLGGSFQIRSQIFLDLAVTERSRIGIAYEHKSNASTNGENPGVETLLLTYGRSF